MFELPKIEFDVPKAYGWHTLVFPHVTDLNHHIESWIDEAYKWLDMRNISRRGLFWALAHGKGKHGERISPVFYFKDHWSAVQMKWRYSGDLITPELP